MAIDRVLNTEHFYGEKYENVRQKLAPDPFLILPNKPKHTLHAGNSFEFYFFFRIQSLLMDKIIKNKRSLELVTSRASGYETRSVKFLYSLYII